MMSVGLLFPCLSCWGNHFSNGARLRQFLIQASNPVLVPDFRLLFFMLTRPLKNPGSEPTGSSKFPGHLLSQVNPAPLFFICPFWNPVIWFVTTLILLLKNLLTIFSSILLWKNNVHAKLCTSYGYTAWWTFRNKTHPPSLSWQQIEHCPVSPVSPVALCSHPGMTQEWAPSTAIHVNTSLRHSILSCVREHDTTFLLRRAQAVTPRAVYYTLCLPVSHYLESLHMWLAICCK